MSCGCSTGATIPDSPPFPSFPPPVGGGTPGASAVPVDPCAGVNPAPEVQTDFVVPAIGSQGQFYSPCAYLFALPGFDLLIPPFGRVTITAVQDNIISYINRSIVEGTTIIAGTRMGVASGWDFGAAPSDNAVEFLLGVIGGYPRLIGGNAGALMQRVLDTDSVLRWKPVQPAVAGFKYYPQASPNTFFTSVSDLSWTGNLPGMPAGNIPCVPTIDVNMVITANNTAVFSRKITLNGFNMAAFGSYYLTGYTYEFHQPCAIPGYTLCMSGNPVTIAITDVDATNFTIVSFSLAVVGWYY